MGGIDDLDRWASTEDTQLVADKSISTDFKTESRKEDLINRKQNREARRKYSIWIFWLLVGYLVVVFSILSLSACKCVCFELSDSVLITLLTTTTANVIGIFIIVVKYLFSK